MARSEVTEELRQKTLADLTLYVKEYTEQQRFAENNSVTLPMEKVINACPIETLASFYTTMKALGMHLPTFKTAKVEKMAGMLKSTVASDEEKLAIYLEIASIAYEDMLYSAKVAEEYVKKADMISNSEYENALIFLEEALFELEQMK